MSITDNRLIKVEGGDVDDGSFTIPKGVTTIERATFSHCTSLTQLVIPEGVSAIQSATFFGCPGLTQFNRCEKNARPRITSGEFETAETDEQVQVNGHSFESVFKS